MCEEYTIERFFVNPVKSNCFEWVKFHEIFKIIDDICKDDPFFVVDYILIVYILG